MQRYKIFFIIVNALHVSGGFSAHHRVYAKQSWHVLDAGCTVFELLMMGGETA